MNKHEIRGDYMNKRMLLVLICILFIGGCNLKKEPTIDMNLKNILYTEEEVQISKDVSATLIATKSYDLESGSESSNIKIYVQDMDLRNEIFMSFVENYLVNKKCNDAECLRYLFSTIFGLEDQFLDESLTYFEDFNKKDENFILLRRELEYYDGYVLFELGKEKKCSKIDNLTYTLGKGNQDSVIIESKVYEVNVDLNK